jgi:hypothetical protein
MGKIIRDKYPDLSEQDQEAIRQRAVAALNLIQMGGKKASGSGATSNTALIDGIRRYVTDVRDLNVDLIDSINPFGEAYNILAKTMNEEGRDIFERLHKIGLTTGDPEKRVSNAKKETTYLFAAVELVAVYRLANINCKAFESLLHKFLARARIDLALADRFGGKVQPREWFLVPLPVVEEVVERIKDGSISNYVFDVETAKLRLRQRG